jgi:TonB family protein
MNFKKIVFFVFLLCGFMNIQSFAQTKEEVFTVVEQMPMFPGGREALTKYLSDNLSYPEEAKKESIEGGVYIQFVVDSQGKISEAKVLKGIGYGCDEEAMRIVKKMPDWIPGKQGGRVVAVRYNLPIKFKLTK